MKKPLYYTHSAHMDLFWMARMERCMELGAKIIDDAVEDLKADSSKHFVIETVRFLEYYLDHYPEKKETALALIREGRLETGACYSDRLENHHSGEALLRNVQYGKKLFHALTGMETRIAAHPDLPGLTEQTPQIYHQAGVDYYTFARGYVEGARFLWPGLNGESIIAYNYPIHYSYYDYERVFKNVAGTAKSVYSEDVLICLSAGDLGDYGSFLTPGVGKEKVADIVEKYNKRDEPYELVSAGIFETLSKMPAEGLPSYQGECPCKWGTYGSATNVESFHRDKELNSLLCDVEKLAALCILKGMKLDDLTMRFPWYPRDNSDIEILPDYYDTKLRPKSLEEWISLAWRLQIITHDHNYGGIDGMCSDFDRRIYKKVSRSIMEHIRDYCLGQLAPDKSGENRVLVFNPSNRKRYGRVSLPCESQAAYRITDSTGTEYPAAREGGALVFEPVLEGLSYKVFRIEEIKAGTQAGETGNTCCTEDQSPACCSMGMHPEEKTGSADSDQVLIENEYYQAVFDKARGGITRLTDKESGMNLLGPVPVGILKLFADPSNDVHELLYDKELLETTAGRIRAVWTERNELYTAVKWESEIADSKVIMTLSLSSLRKEFSLHAEICWVGKEQVQLRMTAGFNPAFPDIYYGIPYGIQKFGNLMYGAEPTNPTDEISMPLFREYREVQGFIAYQNREAGVSIGTNQSAFAFKDNNETEAVLIRDVVSCGDKNVLVDNHGIRRFDFTGTSFREDDVTVNDRYYRQAMENLHPFLYKTFEGAAVPDAAPQNAAKTDIQDGAEREQHCLKEGTLLSAEGGILSAMQIDDDKIYARFFSVGRKEQTINVRTPAREYALERCDLMGNTLDQNTQIRYGDIRTYRLL